MTFQKSDNGFLKISPEALTLMLCYVQDDEHKSESGGILIGRHIIETDDIVIDTVTQPTCFDKQTRFKFFRNKNLHQEILDNHWKNSKHTSTYLGEWHTHPEKYPFPSNIDVKNWNKLVKEIDFFGKSLFFIIVGIDTIKIWELKKGLKSKPIELFERGININNK
ncbi:MAG: Mov34/MPN/PAD-1 family protein [Rhodothermia bacterium]|nr:Mov34/MPN/PAD-1 family protein [Rhodothermia bacterium]